MSPLIEQILRLAKLTALHPRDNLSIDLVLESFDALQKADTSKIHEAPRSGAKTLRLRDDVVTHGEIADDLLTCSGRAASSDRPRRTDRWRVKY